MAEEQPRPPRRPFGRSWSDFEPVSEAEKKLAEAARTGEGCVLGKKVPEEATQENTIRAGFLRFLALGGDKTTPIHEYGVRLSGAFIKGKLDLKGAKLRFDLALLYCRFDTPITLIGTRSRTIALHGSRLVGLKGDGLQLDGDLFLHQVHATDETRLLGARITGNVECVGGRFENAAGIALHFDGAEIGGLVCLNTGFHATGVTRLLGARITGQLDCTNGRFENAGGIALDCDGAEIGGLVCLNTGFHATGVTRLLGARITGQLDCTGGRFENAGGIALGCDNAKLSGGLLFRVGTSAQGTISFAHAEVATLGDDPSLWPENSLRLEGFRYQRITAESPLDAKTRIEWLVSGTAVPPRKFFADERHSPCI